MQYVFIFIFAYLLAYYIIRYACCMYFLFHVLLLILCIFNDHAEIFKLCYNMNLVYSVFMVSPIFFLFLLFFCIYSFKFSSLLSDYYKVIRVCYYLRTFVSYTACFVYTSNNYMIQGSHILYKNVILFTLEIN